MYMYSHYHILAPGAPNIKRPADLQNLNIFGTAGLIDFHPYHQVAVCKLLSQFTKPFCGAAGTCQYIEYTDVQLLGRRYLTVFVVGYDCVSDFIHRSGHFDRLHLYKQ
jgi:hypothetical protein